MGLLAIQQKGARLAVQNGAFVVRLGDRVVLQRAFHDVSDVLLIGAVDLTPEARDTLLSRGIETVFLSAGGRYKGRLVAVESNAARRRVEQARAMADPHRALVLARAVVAAKVRNQRQVLQRVERNRPGSISTQVIAALRATAARAGDADSIDTLRGLEGYAATTYFRGLANAFTHPVLRFEGRNRRPPRDPINACLSFGYALLLARVDGAVRGVGLDPYIGALHDAGRGAPALALDLMEHLRPAIVDRLVLRLVNRQQLSADHFGAPPSDEVFDATEPGERGVWLAPGGREVFFREFAALWRTRQLYGPRGTRHELGDIVVFDAQAIVRFIEDGAPIELFAPE